MKFSKVLLCLAGLTSFAFAEIKEKYDESGKVHSKEECEKGFGILQAYYTEEVEKNPLCTYDPEYAKENELEGDYTMDIGNRDYFCRECLVKYLKIGNPMVQQCGENAPEQMLYDLYFLSTVNSIVCAKDQLQDLYCEVVMDRLFKAEKNKPIIQWNESSLCSECPYYYHNIFKEREQFYTTVQKDSSENSFIGRMLPLHDIEIDCFKEFDFHKKQAMEDRKKEEEAKSNKPITHKKLDINEILNEKGEIKDDVDDDEKLKEIKDKIKERVDQAKKASEEDDESSSSSSSSETDSDTDSDSDSDSDSDDSSSSSSSEEEVKVKKEEKKQPKKGSEAGEL